MSGDGSSSQFVTLSGSEGSAEKSAVKTSRHSIRRRLYVSVRWKLALALAFATTWCLLSAWIARPWFADLSTVAGPYLAAIIIAGIALVPGFANAFLVGGVLLDRRPRFDQHADPPPITVLIAAYNEEQHIRETLRSIAGQRYEAEVEVIVIDDGSRDATASCVEAFVASVVLPPGRSMRLLRMPQNAGKAHALNAGLAQARHTHIVTLDADTYLYRDALRNLALNHSHSPINTRATAGTVLVRNSRHNWLARLQEWDYFQGISVVKRIQSLFQGTLVAQGAFSIYEREALREIGGWEQTVGEDIVLTWALIDRDYRVGYAENAFAFTNVPTTLGAYYRQRRRWARGMIEAFKRFPRVLIRPRLNLPFIYLNILFPYLDLVFLTVFLPGIVAAVFFQFYAVVGLMTLFLLPLALAISLLMFAHQRRVFRGAGLKVRRNFLGFLGYLVAYQVVLTPASLAGYFGEFFNVRKSW